MKKQEELHKMSDCTFYGVWVGAGQTTQYMFDAEWNQICENCRAQKFGQPDAKKSGYPDWQLSK